MPVAGGGFEQCYNAQAAVAAGSLLVVAADVVQAPNDKQQLAPMLSKIAALPDALGEADSAAGRQRLFQRGQCDGLHAAAGIDPLIAMGREAASSLPGRAFRRCTAAHRTTRHRSRPWPTG